MAAATSMAADIRGQTIRTHAAFIPFDPEAANLMFSLISARYERASLIVTSNKAFSAWGEIFGDRRGA
jgi:DNA replication protein DnaC